MTAFLREYRCESCKKLLFKGILVESAVETKCVRCGEINKFQGVSSNSLICLKEYCPNRISLPEAFQSSASPK